MTSSDAETDSKPIIIIIYYYYVVDYLNVIKLISMFQRYSINFYVSTLVN